MSSKFNKFFTNGKLVQADSLNIFYNHEKTRLANFLPLLILQ